MILVGRFCSVVGWGIAILLGLGLYSAAKDGELRLPNLSAVPWEHISASTYGDDCPEKGTYAAIGEKDDQPLYFERPCDDPPPEHLR